MRTLKICIEGQYLIVFVKSFIHLFLQSHLFSEKRAKGSRFSKRREKLELEHLPNLHRNTFDRKFTLLKHFIFMQNEGP